VEIGKENGFSRSVGERLALMTKSSQHLAQLAEMFAGHDSHAESGIPNSSLSNDFVQ